MQGLELDRACIAQSVQVVCRRAQSPQRNMHHLQELRVVWEGCRGVFVLWLEFLPSILSKSRTLLPITPLPTVGGAPSCPRGPFPYRSSTSDESLILDGSSISDGLGGTPCYLDAQLEPTRVPSQRLTTSHASMDAISAARLIRAQFIISSWVAISEQHLIIIFQIHESSWTMTI